MPRAERRWLEQLRRMAAPGTSRVRPVVTGIGDDCAVLRAPTRHELLVTTDFSLEGVHFRRDWQPAESVGHRCLARGFSDIAAMGGEPLAVFLSLALPADLPQKWVEGFYSGLLALARRHKVALAGGDTAQSPAGVLADIMVVGSVPHGKAILRSGAKAGDRIYVTGELGESAAEIRRRYTSLGRGVRRSAAKAGSPARQRWDYTRTISSPGRGDRFFFPEPRLAAGKKFRSLASAMIDISDGLSTDLSHICDESKVGALIYQSSLPVASNATLEDALHGGDDYELLFTSSKRVAKQLAGVSVTEIGEIVNRKGMWIQDERGRTTRLKAAGWEHFSSR